MENKVIESTLEGILFTAGEPLECSRIAMAIGCSEQEVDQAAARLGDFYRYEQRGIRLVKLERSYQLTSAPEHADAIRRALETRKPPQLSPALLEVLSIIAYFQPTTRGYIEQVRGVSSAYSVNTLLERGLIEECGKLSVPGRPTLFQTTKLFLKTFGLSSLEDLPSLPESGEEKQGGEKK
ncbi:MAG: SMC-Scp complex subunit ScpB [Oscillospiraceae bacterium]|nr:SMC-Scp complex subunit ScpB [Oscillospiraceae bacterium]